MSVVGGHEFLGFTEEFLSGKSLLTTTASHHAL
jgi:hypothetical protein